MCFKRGKGTETVFEHANITAENFFKLMKNYSKGDRQL